MSRRPRDHFMPDRKERRVGLARALSKMGYCSRAQATELIRAGQVRLNGSNPHDPETPVRLGKDRIEVDGESIKTEKKVYLVLNKPRGAVTTASDEKGRGTVYAYLPEGARWVAPVGRLDKASEGLLLLTNDSEWGARVTTPETHLDKTYHVQVAGDVSATLLEAMTKGIRTKEGGELRAKSAEILRRGAKNTWLVVVLDEGKNRQIRRMLEASGIEILRLIRISIGPLELGDLRKGGCRPLTSGEKEALDRAMNEAAGEK
jgi:23S rRNA pseudouridine2605 synthase